MRGTALSPCAYTTEILSLHEKPEFSINSKLACRYFLKLLTGKRLLQKMCLVKTCCVRLPVLDETSSFFKVKKGSTFCIDYTHAKGSDSLVL